MVKKYTSVENVCKILYKSLWVLCEKNCSKSHQPVSLCVKNILSTHFSHPFHNFIHNQPTEDIKQSFPLFHHYYYYYNLYILI